MLKTRDRRQVEGSFEDGAAPPDIVIEQSAPDGGLAVRSKSTGISAVTFTVLLVIGLSLLADTWDIDDSDAQILSWYEDGGNRVRQLVGAVLLAAAGLAFLWFINELRTRFVTAGERTFTSLMTMGGSIFVATLFVGSAAIGAVSADVEIADNPVPTSVDVVRILESFGLVTILIFGLVAAALCVFSASRAGRVTGEFPLWLTRLGYGAAVLLIFGAFFFPAIALPLWAMIVGIWSFRARAA